MNKRLIFVILCVLFVGAGLSSGDWDPNYKMHWPQLPDLSATGVDIANMGTSLADDFMCIESGPITDIHIWGSFGEDILPDEGAGNLTFQLTIRGDIPASGDVWSRPGEMVLWSQVFAPGQYTVRQVADNIVEDWYDPVSEVYLPANHSQAYQYNFYITDEPFEQEV